MMLNTFTIADIRDEGPCYDPVYPDARGCEAVFPDKFFPADWSGTALDVLKEQKCPAFARLQVVLRKKWIDERTLRIFAARIARKALDRHVEIEDLQYMLVCDVAERYASGQAPAGQLRLATYRAAERAYQLDRNDDRQTAHLALWSAACAATDDAEDAARGASREAGKAAAARKIAEGSWNINANEAWVEQVRDLIKILTAE